jgi:hypothetical protein
VFGSSGVLTSNLHEDSSYKAELASTKQGKLCSKQRCNSECSCNARHAQQLPLA